MAVAWTGWDPKLDWDSKVPPDLTRPHGHWATPTVPLLHQLRHASLSPLAGVHTKVREDQMNFKQLSALDQSMWTWMMTRDPPPLALPACFSAPIRDVILAPTHHHLAVFMIARGLPHCWTRDKPAFPGRSPGQILPNTRAACTQASLCPGDFRVWRDPRRQSPKYDVTWRDVDMTAPAALRWALAFTPTRSGSL